MSYATSLLTTYPSLYGPSTLLSDELVQRPTFSSYYEPMSSYAGSGRLLSDSFTYNQLGTGLTSYQRPTITNWQRDLQPPTSYASFNDVREYSESLGTASNTSTASTVAHSIHENNFNGSTSIFPNYQRSYSRIFNDVDRPSYLTPIWSPSRARIITNDEKPTPTYRSVPQLSTNVTQKQASIEEMLNHRTPVPSPLIITKQGSHLQIPTITDHDTHYPHHQQKQQHHHHQQEHHQQQHHHEQHQEHQQVQQQQHPHPQQEQQQQQQQYPPTQQEHHHQGQQQQRQHHDQEHHHQEHQQQQHPHQEHQQHHPHPQQEHHHQQHHPHPQQEHHHQQHHPQQEHHHQQQQQQEQHQEPSSDVQVWLNESKGETSVNEKPVEQIWTEKIDHLHTVQEQREKEKAKSSRALPSLPKRQDEKSPNKVREASFQIRTNSYFDSLFDGNYVRKNSQNQPPALTRNQTTNGSFNKTNTSLYPKYIAPRKALQYQAPTINRTLPITTFKKTALSPRENIHKDADDRFREALNKFRLDRAEQQQRETTESTAKRLHYGDYVRHTSKDKLLHSAVKPLPWSDFMDMKKGNVYSLKKEEKKELYNQSRSYGERIRHRNFALLFGSETARTQPRSIPLPVVNQEPQSAAETSPEDDQDDSKSLEQPDSGEMTNRTNQTYTKPIVEPAMISEEVGRKTNFTDQSSTIRPSDEEDDDTSDAESSGKAKESTRYSKYESSTSATEESDTDQRSSRMRNRETDDDLFTVREEKTLESFEGARYKKR